MDVALVTIGDELLAGETVNTNAAWLGRRLAERGADLERVTVVPDRVADIAQVVNEYRATYDAVIVTGGLGPTHDDVTMEGVAAAFGTELAPSAEVAEWLETEGGYSADDLAEGTTHIPKGSQLLRNPNGVAPGCQIDSVYVLAGLPDEMRGMFEEIAAEFTGTARHVEVVETSEPESALLDRVETLREKFDIKVGSYPGENVRLRVEGTDENTVSEAVAWVRDRVEMPANEADSGD
jgi:molybdenum cofactor synthesis domain-containing protein